MEKTLKDLLEPPFKYDSNGAIIGKRKGVENHDWPLIVVDDDSFFGFNDVQINEIMQLIAQALNNEWERQYGEPKRWMYNDAETDCMYYCPACKVGADDLLEYHFCFRCGVRLWPPDWEEQYKPYQTKPDKSRCPNCPITDCICSAERKSE